MGADDPHDHQVEIAVGLAGRDRVGKAGNGDVGAVQLPLPVVTEDRRVAAAPFRHRAAGTRRAELGAGARRFREVVPVLTVER